MSVDLSFDRQRYSSTYAMLYVRNLDEESFAPLQFSIKKEKRSINSWQEQNFTHDCHATKYIHMALQQSDFNNDSKTCDLYIAVKPIFSHMTKNSPGLAYSFLYRAAGNEGYA